MAFGRTGSTPVLGTPDSEEFMKSVTILIKPASGKCNMRCRYCFYQDEAENREYKDYGMMSEETAKALIDKALKSFDDVTFAFQGGEPTCRGLDFFRFFSAYATEKGNRVHFAIQTNGFALNREWISFFNEYHYLVGLSLDGDKALHDKYRIDGSGKGTYKRVFSTFQLFSSQHVTFNVLITLTKDAAMRGGEIYKFLKRNGARYQQYIPCIDPIAKDRGGEDFSLTPEAYLHFLKEVFSLYYRDWERGDYVSVRYFDNLVNMMMGLPPESCGLLGFCPSTYVAEADGSIFPCDFYVLDDYLLGNINTDSFSDFDKKRTAIGFTEKSMKVESACRNCPVFMLCRGGCRRDRENFRTGELELSYLCPAYKEFLGFALPGLSAMARVEMMARQRGFS